MFLRPVTAAGGQGVPHESVRLVAASREDGRTQPRVVGHLGRKDLLAAHRDSLMRLLRGERTPRGAVRVGAGPATGAGDWGPMVVARTLGRDLGLEARLAAQGGRGPAAGRALADRALGRVAHRRGALTREHGRARWLEPDFVGDRPGRRWRPAGRGEAERRASRRPRGRVELRQLTPWSRTLDPLAARTPPIAQALSRRRRDLGSLTVDLALEDLTSTYVEGQGPPTLGAHGHRRDGKPRHRPGLVGGVRVDGWPSTHPLVHGSARDATTVPQGLADLEPRVGRRRVGFVGDRGRVTSAKLALLRTRQPGDVVGLTRRRREDVDRSIERATGPWTDGPVGSPAREQSAPPKTRVHAVERHRPGVRIFVGQSEERLAFERTQRLRAMARVRRALAALERRVARGPLKPPAQIGAAAARILGRAHGSRDDDWTDREGRFRFFEPPVNLPREPAYEGPDVIQTEDPWFTPVAAVTIDKELSEVERAFATLKDVIEMRPLSHQPDAPSTPPSSWRRSPSSSPARSRSSSRPRGGICRPPRPCRSFARSGSWTSPWAETSASAP